MILAKHNKEKDTVTIRAERQANRLQLSVSNRSSSLAASWEELLGRGLGLSTTRERIEQLYGGEGTSFRLFNVQPTGVRAEVTLPFRILINETGQRVAEVNG